MFPSVSCKVARFYSSLTDLQWEMTSRERTLSLAIRQRFSTHHTPPKVPLHPQETRLPLCVCHGLQTQFLTNEFVVEGQTTATARIYLLSMRKKTRTGVKLSLQKQLRLVNQAEESLISTKQCRAFQTRAISAL